MSVVVSVTKAVDLDAGRKGLYDVRGNNIIAEARNGTVELKGRKLEEQSSMYNCLL